RQGDRLRKCKLYFWKGCMPGADRNLCKVCIGGGEMEGVKVSSRCAANHNERYYGNMGAFGDVAFLEHHNLLKNIESWATGYTLNDFELLCLDGRRVAVTDWGDCNLGPLNPIHFSLREVATWLKIHLLHLFCFLLFEFFLFFSVKETLETNLDSKFHLFHSQKYGESDLLFKDATQYLVHTRHLGYQSILGEPFFQLAESVFNCTHAGNVT
uniref:Transferrin-like domain-containing protein n=1 Tax=Chelydra serpentina TaxID=8475 RepID=A0A8C3SYD7_CHESE